MKLTKKASKEIGQLFNSFLVTESAAKSSTGNIAGDVGYDKYVYWVEQRKKVAEEIMQKYNIKVIC